MRMSVTVNPAVCYLLEIYGVVRQTGDIEKEKKEGLLFCLKMLHLLIDLT